MDAMIFNELPLAARMSDNVLNLRKIMKNVYGQHITCKQLFSET